MVWLIATKLGMVTRFHPHDPSALNIMNFLKSKMAESCDDVTSGVDQSESSF